MPTGVSQALSGIAAALMSMSVASVLAWNMAKPPRRSVVEMTFTVGCRGTPVEAFVTTRYSCPLNPHRREGTKRCSTTPPARMAKDVIQLDAGMLYHGSSCVG